MTNEVKHEAHEVGTVLDSPETVVAPVTPAGRYKLTPAQQHAATMILTNDLTVKRSGVRRKEFNEIAAELGIHRNTLLDWRSQPEFQRYIDDATRMALSGSVTMAVARLHELADGTQTGTSSIKAIELIMTYAGLLDRKRSVDVNVTHGAPAVASMSDEQLGELLEQYADDSTDN